MKAVRTFFGSLRIGLKLGILFGLMVLLSLVSFFIIRHYQDLLYEDNQVINVAGRQRMLTQQIALLSELTYSGVEGSSERLKHAIQTYEGSHQALINGGKVPGFNLELTGTEDQEAIQRGDHILKKWKIYKDNAEQILETEHSEGVQKDPIAWESISYIRDHSLDMLQENVALVKAFVSLSDRNQSKMTYDLIMIIGLAAGIALAGLWVAQQLIVNPIKQISSVTSKVALGQLDVSIERGGKDEIGMMAQSVRDLVEGLKSTARFSSEVGKGNFDVEYKLLSQEDVLGNSLLEMQRNMKEIIHEINEVINQAGSQGKLNVRIDNTHKQGVFKLLSESINNLLTTMATPVMALNEMISALADGDLSTRYEHEAKGDISELVKNLNQALDNINSLLHQIAESAAIIDQSSNEMLFIGEEMTLNTEEIASAVAQMSTGAQTQVTKINASSEVAEKMRGAFTVMENKSGSINEAAKAGVESSRKGIEMVLNVVENMSSISIYSQKTGDSISVLTERSNEIARVLGVITDIAAQTNLLALNAAIEAAQAGDAGRGFAVVAEEIRKLAEDSRNSAQEIEALINDVKNDTQSAVLAMDKMDKSVKSGEEASHNVSEVFEEITESSSQTLISSEEIAAASRGQVDDIQSIVNITSDIAVVAEQTAAGTEESASSAAELSSGMQNYLKKSKKLVQIASDLTENLAKFKLSSCVVAGVPEDSILVE